MRSNKCSISICIYVSMRQNTTQPIFLSYVYLYLYFLSMYIMLFVIFHHSPFFHFIFKRIISLSRETRGEPPPDVVSGENVTLPSSFIALRREAITTMIFLSFFLLSFFFAFIFIQQTTKKIIIKKIVIPGPTTGSCLVFFLHVHTPPHH